MKKILPILLVIMSFMLFLAGQVGFDIFSTRASFSGRDNAKAKYFSDSLRRLKVKTMSGRNIDFSANKTPIIVVNFWASWCSPCLKEFPSLSTFKEQFRESELLVLAVNSDDSDLFLAKKKVEAKLGKRLDFEFLSDNNKLTSLFEITAIPSTVIFVHGKVYDVISGAMDFSDKKLISDLKAQI